MALTAGQRLGPYEIVAALGAGGMGEVYKAKDTRLDRTVAIKVLPATLASDPQFRERFEREAKSISALNHPNICTLHDVGRLRPDGAPATQGGVAEVEFLVMEFLDGETLAARVSRGPVPLAEALRVAMEIASALDKAHRQGIVHRDLKPGNVMLTKTGSKLLDFGLAKVGPAGALSGAHVTTMPTATAPLTAQGTILGTFQYMAPEQVEGEETDARSDIFAFGAVLFEMLTGRKAFTGKSQASLLGAILKDEPPPVSQIVPVAPPALDYLVRTCLAKDPDARFQTAHDLLLQLKWLAEAGSAAGVPAPVVAHRRNRERTAWIAAAGLGVALIGAAAVAVIHLREAPPVVDPLQFTIGSPENSLFFGQAPQFAISPDGKQVVFGASNAANANLLWVRPLGTLVPHQLPGTESATYPFWSADSRFIGFFSGGKLKKVPLSGGPPTILSDAPSGRGGTWNQDNVIVFAPTPGGPLHRVTSAGGASTPVTELAKGDGSYRWPAFLPDGRRFIFFSVAAGGVGEVRLGSLDSKDITVIGASETRAVFGAGHLFFVRAGSLMAQPFDSGLGKAVADPFPIADQISGDAAAYSAFSVSTTGTLAYSRGSARPVSRLTWFDRSGKSQGTVGDPGEYFNVSLSPDERRVGASLQTGSPPNRDVWILDLARGGAPSRFTFDPAADGVAVFSAASDQIAFASNRTGPYNIYMKAASGGGREEAVQKSTYVQFLNDWSRDGKYLAYTEINPGTGMDLFVVPLTGDKKPIPILQSPFNEDNPVFSPDGHWIAYDSNEAGATQIYVCPFPADGSHYMVSRNGGSQAMWSADGQELFFLAPDTTLMVASITTTKNFEPGVPKALFTTGVAFTGNRRQYAVAKSGRFLVNVPEQRTSPAPIVVVVNWLATLQK